MLCNFDKSLTIREHRGKLITLLFLLCKSRRKVILQILQNKPTSVNTETSTDLNQKLYRISSF